MFALYSRTFAENAKWLHYILLETVATEFTIMSFVCFIRAVKYRAASFFPSARLRVLTEYGRTRGNVEVLTSLLCKMKASILKPGLLRITSNCAVDLVALILAFTRAAEIDWMVRDCLGGFLDDFAAATITSVLN